SLRLLTRSRTWNRFPTSQLSLSRWRSIRPCRPITSTSWSPMPRPILANCPMAPPVRARSITSPPKPSSCASASRIHVPYRGAGPAIADILAGQIPMIVPAMTNIVLELHRAGKLRVLAVTHGTRLTAAPELPTAVEQRLTELVAPNFVGVFAPTGTPKPIIDQVAQANLALLADHDYRELLVSGTFEPHGDLGPKHTGATWTTSSRAGPRLSGRWA